MMTKPDVRMGTLKSVKTMSVSPFIESDPSVSTLASMVQTVGRETPFTG